MSSTLLILNDPPYGTERSYNALRAGRARCWTRVPAPCSYF